MIAAYFKLDMSVAQYSFLLYWNCSKLFSLCQPIYIEDIQKMHNRHYFIEKIARNHSRKTLVSLCVVRKNKMLTRFSESFFALYKSQENSFSRIKSKREKAHLGHFAVGVPCLLFYAFIWGYSSTPVSLSIKSENVSAIFSSRTQY